MMKNKSNTSKFCRILKELGIYSLWLRERKKFILSDFSEKSCGKDQVFNCVKIGLCDCINESFTWEKTSNRQMWQELFYEASFNGMTLNNTIRNEKSLKKLRECVMRYKDI